MEQNRYSAEALAKFLDYAVEKGLIKRNTATSRKVAAAKILEVLDEDDKKDLRNLDINSAFNRFQNKSGRSFKPESLAVYKSRFSIALNDFLRWTENPAGFRPSSATRSAKSDSNEPAVKRARTVLAKNSASLVIPVPIREGLFVEIANIPSDLTKDEAAKIAGVIQALAVGEKGR